MKRKGVSLILVLAVVMLLSTLAVSAVAVTSSTTKTNYEADKEDRVNLTAQSGIEKGVAQLDKNINTGETVQVIVSRENAVPKDFVFYNEGIECKVTFSPDSTDKKAIIITSNAYTKDKKYNKTLTYLYTNDKISDGTIVQQPAADVAEANPDFLEVTYGQGPKSVNVLANDKGPGLTLQAITQQPKNGTVTSNADGTITYNLTSSTATSDVIEYSIKDKNGVVSSSTLTVTVKQSAPVVQQPEPPITGSGAFLYTNGLTIIADSAYLNSLGAYGSGIYFDKNNISLTVNGPVYIQAVKGKPAALYSQGKKLVDDNNKLTFNGGASSFTTNAAYQGVLGNALPPILLKEEKKLQEVVSTIKPGAPYTAKYVSSKDNKEYTIIIASGDYTFNPGVKSYNGIYDNYLIYCTGKLTFAKIIGNQKQYIFNNSSICAKRIETYDNPMDIVITSKADSLSIPDGVRVDLDKYLVK